jgi:hypothetical protein
MSLPALFLTAVCITYLLTAPHSGGGMALPLKTSLIIAAAGSAAVLILFLVALKNKRNNIQ